MTNLNFKKLHYYLTIAMHACHIQINMLKKRNKQINGNPFYALKHFDAFEYQFSTAGPSSFDRPQGANSNSNSNRRLTYVCPSVRPSCVCPTNNGLLSSRSVLTVACFDWHGERERRGEERGGGGRGRYYVQDADRQ